MGYSITSISLAVVFVGLIAVLSFAFVSAGASSFNTTVPSQYTERFEQFESIEAQYGSAEETADGTGFDSDSSDIGIVKGVPIAAKQLKNTTSLGVGILSDTAYILGIPANVVYAIGVVIVIITIISGLMFVSRNSRWL